MLTLSSLPPFSFLLDVFSAVAHLGYWKCPVRDLKLSAARSIVELCVVILVIIPSPDDFPSHKICILRLIQWEKGFKA